MIAIVVGTVVLAAVVLPFAREFVAVDGCLDGGGSFDYVVEREQLLVLERDS